MTDPELQSKITQLEQECNKIKYSFESTLTSEQLELYKQMSQFRAKELAPLLNARSKTNLEETIRKAKEADPLIKEVIREVSKEVIKEVPKEVIREVSKEVIKEVPKEVIKEVPKEAPKPVVTIKKEDTRRPHYILPLVSKAVNAKCHVWLVGPAGSGKTTLASQVASQANLPFAALSVCSQTTKTDLLGYLDAQGVYRTTNFRQIYENGGVFCLDEIDNGNANVLAVLNSAISNDTNFFPDKTVTRHPNFIVVACANTFGLGATNGYVGRTQIDAATLDRFFFIEMTYDDGLESHVAGVSGIASPVWNEMGTSVTDPNTWISLVKKTREAANQLGVKIIVSPRATYMGISLIKQGVPLYYLEKGLLYKSISTDLINKLRQA